MNIYQKGIIKQAKEILRIQYNVHSLYFAKKVARGAFKSSKFTIKDFKDKLAYLKTIKYLNANDVIFTKGGDYYNRKYKRINQIRL